MGTLQGMLHRNAAVHLRIRRPWRSISEASFGWGACNGMGYSRGRNHGKHCSNL